MNLMILNGHIVINSDVFKEGFFCLKCDLWISIKYFIKSRIKN